MELKPSEIEAIEEIGELDGSPVKMIRTIGGFWIAVGKPKGKKDQEALGAGSHPAIVKYNVEKQFSAFQPTLAKSELTGSSESVTGYTELLPQEMRKNGYEMFSLTKSNEIEYVLTKHGAQVHVFKAEVQTDKIKFDKAAKPLPSNLKGFSKAATTVATHKAKELGKEFIEYDNVKFPIKKLLKG
jgi:hypothetical protein